MSPRITAIETVGTSRLRVVLDDGASLDLSAEVAACEGLRSGDPLDARLRARLEDADLRWKAREAALHLLAHRARSRRELRDRLTRKGFPAAVARSCLEELAERGLVDDEAFARTFVRDRLRLNPKGRRALAMELAKRGIGSDIADAAIQEVFAEEDTHDRDLAHEAALAWLRRQPASIRRALSESSYSEERERARRRLHGYLARRGFSGSASLRALEELNRLPTAEAPWKPSSSTS